MFLAFTTDEHLMSKLLFSPFRYPTNWNRWSVEPTALYHHTTFTSHIVTHLIPRDLDCRNFYVPRPNTISISNTISIRGFFVHGSQKGLWPYPPPLFSVKIRLKMITTTASMHLNYYHYHTFPDTYSFMSFFCSLTFHLRFLLHNYCILYHYVLATGFQLPCIPLHPENSCLFVTYWDKLPTKSWSQKKKMIGWNCISVSEYSKRTTRTLLEVSDVGL